MDPAISPFERALVEFFGTKKGETAPREIKKPPGEFLPDEDAGKTNPGDSAVKSPTLEICFERK